MARQLARRHRRERVAGILIAVLGVAVLVVAVIALRNPKQTSSQAGTATHTVAASSASSTPKSSSSKPSAKSSSKSAPKSASASSSASSSVKSVPLIVLNDTKTSDLARDAARRFESGGWKVTSFDENFSNNILSTAAYYDPDTKGAEKAANALQQQYPTIQRVVARFPELPNGPIVVVLTSGYSPN